MTAQMQTKRRVDERRPDKARRRPRKVSALELLLKAKGFHKISISASKIGKSVLYIHRAIKTGALALGDDTGKPSVDVVRVGHMFYVRESSLGKLVGQAAAKLLGLKAS
jgi:hypothetical protein